MLITQRNETFFLISSMVLDRLNQLQCFWQLYLVEMLELSTGLGLLKLDISKAFGRVWHAGLRHKVRSYGILGQIFGLISSFLMRWLWVVQDGNSSQVFATPVNVGVSRGSRLGPTIFLLYINDLPDVICNIAIYADDTNLYYKFDQTSALWQQLEMAPELELNWGSKWLVNFNAGRTQLVSFDWSNTDAIDVKIDGSVLEEKSSFKMLGLTFSAKLDWGSYIISIAKTAS